MSLNLSSTQGTKLYVANEDISFNNAFDVNEAIINGVAKEVKVILSISSTSKTKRSIKISVINANEVSYIQGNKSLETKDISVLLNSFDVDGQNELKEMFKNRTKKYLITESTEKTDSVFPIYETFLSFAIKSEKQYQKGSAYVFNSSVQPISQVVEMKLENVKKIVDDNDNNIVDDAGNILYTGNVKNTYI